MPAGGRLDAGDREALDGLRGLAALIVVASHASNLGLHLVPGWSLAGIGKSGVYLFFVLSAFLLTWQWLSTERANRFAPAWVAGYFLRRIARIYPLYAVILLIGWALAPRGLGVPMDGTAVWTHLTLREGRDIYWSIPVEFLYYLCIPPLAWALSIAGGKRAVGAGVIVAAVALSSLAWPAAEAPLNSITLGYYLPIFLAGSAAAWWAVGRGGDSAIRPSASNRLADAGMLLVLVLAVPSVAVLAGGSGAADATHRAFIPWGLFWALLLLGTLRGWLPTWRQALRWRGLQACGRWCFGIYLLHMPALLVLNHLPWLPPTLKGWLALALALVLAALAHRGVELPAIRRASSWGRSMTSPLVSAR